jgi:hypothetical protein
LHILIFSVVIVIASLVWFFKRMTTQAVASHVVDDPLVGAAAISISILKSQRVYNSDIKQQLMGSLRPYAENDEQVKNALDVGEWITDQGVPPRKIISAIGPHILSKLTAEQRFEVFEFINHALEHGNIDDDIGASFMLQIRKELALQ